MKYVPFMKWWLFFTLICVSTIIVLFTGFFNAVWQKDGSYLSWLILSIFYTFSVICGLHTFNLCNVNEFNQDELDDFLQKEEVGWFVSELCLTLGMLGTVVGFVFMLSGFETIDMSKQQTIQDLLTDLGGSMATALYTTLIGLFCGSVLKIQYFNLSLELQKIVKKLTQTKQMTPEEKFLLEAKSSQGE